MPIEILMPALSPTMTHGNLAKWMKKEGDKIKAGQVIAEIETDKATMEVEAVDSGTIAKIYVGNNAENVAVNTVIALLTLDGESLDTAAYVPKGLMHGSKAKPKDSGAQEVSTTHSETNTNSINSSKDASNGSAMDFAKPSFMVELEAILSNGHTGSKNQIDSSVESEKGGMTASPLAKKIALEANINIGHVHGTGPDGRVVKEDVLEYIQSGKAFTARKVVRNEQEFELVKNNNIRKVIAKRLQESKQFVPHFYLSVDVDMTRLSALRDEINSIAPTSLAGNKAYKVSINDMIIKACALALKQVPEANSSWTDSSTVLYNNVDVAVAVSIDSGLITPIIRNAEQKDVFSISNEMKSLAAKARDGKLQPEEFQGGTFSISNLGMYGIKNFQAIVNPPQTAILAVGAAQKVVAACEKTGAFYLKEVMNITLSADHRVVDGTVGAKLINAIKHNLEKPTLLVL